MLAKFLVIKKLAQSISFQFSVEKEKKNPLFKSNSIIECKLALQFSSFIAENLN